MDFVCVEAGLIQTNCYVIMDNNKNKAIVVDSALNSAEALFEILNKHNLELELIILTHSHWDHAGDAPLMHKKTGAKVLVHKADEFRLLKPNENLLMNLPYVLEPMTPHGYLSHLEKIRFGSMEFEIRHTPGHTEGSISLINHKDKIVFCGDTLFNKSIGRTDLPGGSTEKIMESIQFQLLTLEDDYKVYSGHGPETTIGEERLFNPFLNGEFN